jgi:hypothetical protein
VFPRYEQDASLDVAPVPKARAFAKLAMNSFNYDVLGPDGFDAVGRLLEASDVYRVRYGTLADAVATLRALATERARRG